MKSIQVMTTVAAGCLCLATSAGAAIFELDRLTIVKNGFVDPVMIDDSFDNGDPTVGPNFRNGGPSGYGIRPDTPGSTAVTEAENRLRLNAAEGELITTSGGRQYTRAQATLFTNRSNDPADLGVGLKADDSFTITALFDLAEPGSVFESYEVRLTDNVSNPSPNDLVALRVQGGGTSGDAIIQQYLDRDGSGPNFQPLATMLLDPGNAQIAFRFEKADASTKTVSSSFAYVNASVGDLSEADYLLALEGLTWIDGVDVDLFTDDLFTRFQVQSRAPVPLPAAAWLFIGALGALGVTARRRS